MWILLLVLIGYVIWNEKRFRDMNTKFDALMWSMSQEISRQEFESLKNTVRRIKRDGIQ